jgi:hypothetical protein
VKFTMSNRVPNGTVLTMGISYGGREPGGDTRGRTNPTIYTYALLKAGGLWYMTGSGQTPQAAGWGAVDRWLSREGRVVEWVKAATDWTDLWPVAPSPDPEVDTSQATA